MNSSEKKAINTFILDMVNHKNRKMVPAKIFNKRARKHSVIMALSVKDILNEWKRLHKKLEK
jgi:hypothetical protein